jgi:hypothetical protein
MLKDVNGKVNGVRMGPYTLWKEYAVPEEIDRERAELFIGSAMAEEVVPPPVVESKIENILPSDPAPADLESTMQRRSARK